MSSRFEQVLLAPLIRPLRDEFSRAGYADPIGQRGLFEEEADQGRVDYQLGAMVEEISVSYCSNGAGTATRIDGRIRVKVRWQLFDPAARRIMITKTTEGFYQTTGSEQMRESEFFDRAYRQTVRAVLADQKFYDVAIDNTSAPETAGGASARTPAATTVALKRVPPFTGSLSNNMTNVRAAVVTIAQAGGTGSGFFIGEDGYVVTNSHVVAGNRFVRVKLATGRELVGEVVKQDVGRDVALIKTEGNRFVALPVSPGEGNVGGEVTAIGSPLGEALSGTVTRGIISAYRVIDGKRYIQSDVSILPGNSGGPLLDGNGRVIGIAVAKLPGAEGRVNFFVPIQEALDKLELRIRD
jgi:S1-C subfamily serine protease